MINVEKVKEVFSNLSETEDNDMHDLVYQGKGYVLHLTGAPKEWIIQLLDTRNAETQYDSYGYGSLEDGFVVISILNSTTQEFKYFSIPVEYASYEGWSVYPEKIKEVYQATKIITAWENV
jgi:hypothetical protein